MQLTHWKFWWGWGVVDAEPPWAPKSTPPISDFISCSSGMVSIIQTPRDPLGHRASLVTAVVYLQVCERSHGGTCCRGGVRRQTVRGFPRRPHWEEGGSPSRRAPGHPRARDARVQGKKCIKTLERASIVSHLRYSRQLNNTNILF